MRRRAMKDYIELTKPRITWLILVSTGIGFLFGHAVGIAWFWTLIWTLLGTGLVASGTAALNQWYEREAATGHFGNFLNRFLRGFVAGKHLDVFTGNLDIVSTEPGDLFVGIWVITNVSDCNQTM